MNNNYLYIFLHIHKTAGATIVKHLLENYKPGEYVPISFPDLTFNGVANSRDEYLKRCKKYLNRFSDKELDNVKVVFGHQVPYGIHKFFRQPARYVTIFREPDARAISQYNFFRTRYERETLIGKKHDQFANQLLINNKLTSFPQWAVEKYAHPELWVNTMYQLLTTLGYVKEKKGFQIDIEETLNKFYFTGLTEKSKEDVNFIFYLLNINKYFVNQNVSIKYVDNEQMNRSKKTLTKKNKLDYVIYKSAIIKNNKYKEEYEFFNEKANSIKLKRSLLTPFHQIRYDPKNFLVEFSGLLRSKSKLYKKVFDLVRGH